MSDPRHWHTRLREATGRASYALRISPNLESVIAQSRNSSASSIARTLPLTDPRLFCPAAQPSAQHDARVLGARVPPSHPSHPQWQGPAECAYERGEGVLALGSGEEALAKLKGWLWRLATPHGTHTWRCISRISVQGSLHALATSLPLTFSVDTV